MVSSPVVMLNLVLVNMLSVLDIVMIHNKLTMVVSVQIVVVVDHLSIMRISQSMDCGMVMFAKQVLVDKSVVNGRNIDRIGLLFLMLLVMSVELLLDDVIFETVVVAVVMVGSVLVEVSVGLVMLSMLMVNVVLIRLHFEDEAAVVGVSVGWVESARVGLEGAASTMPSTSVEGVEIVAPVEHELLGVRVPGVNLNVVVQQIPGHVGRVETVAPRVESRSPEVHSEGLRFVHMLDS